MTLCDALRNDAAWGPLLGYVLMTQAGTMTIFPEDGTPAYLQLVEDALYQRLYRDIFKGIMKALDRHGEHMAAPTMRISPVGPPAMVVANNALIQSGQ